LYYQGAKIDDTRKKETLHYLPIIPGRCIIDMDKCENNSTGKKRSCRCPETNGQRRFSCERSIHDKEDLSCNWEKIIHIFRYLKPVNCSLNSNPKIVPDDKNLQWKAKKDKAKHKKW